ncbi:Alpha/Beta hydrolase protein [Sordaria brevicollis]|uniref:Alpha/Beta hydrolase protein n=1 Tax=Sordaria brevicollis TaxID=83679 RepID=A0AAE0UDF4_SORBR|nr:Alpha/Beta hydrolase protein [Sordaria brevicollis]
MRSVTLSLLAGLAALGRAACPVGGDASVVAHDGTAKGTYEVHNNITMYISHPPSCKPSTAAGAGDKTAILYLTDVFGLKLPQNLLLADSFARAGYLTVAPDLFNGEPAPGDINTPGFNTTLFLSLHGTNATDPIIASTISYLRTTLGVTRIGAAGYCFGGKYAFRFLEGNTNLTAQSETVDAAFTAHPSLLENEEIVAIQGPVAIAAAENDELLPLERKLEIEALLKGTGREYGVNLYSGTNHGFAVRADVSDREQRFAKEGAFLQAVRWFGEFL